MDVRQELAEFLLKKVKDRELSPKVAAQYYKELDQSAKSQGIGADDDFAIIGSSCVFPDAAGKDQFWDNLQNGVNSINDLSPSRKANFKISNDDLSEYTHKAGYLNQIDHFDNEYFNVSPSTAEQMDPYHRLMLQVLLDTVEDAGYSDTDFKGRKIGVYVGNDHTQRYLGSYLSKFEEIDAGILTGSWTAILASRLSYHLNLTGPAMVIDSSCSSTLAGIDIAIKSIKDGDCEAALVGAANIYVNKEKFNIQVYSSDNRVKTFDESADGTMFSEGVAGILIKPLSHAIRDKDNIQGIIKGVAVNNDGKSNGITAPRAKAQVEVIKKAWKRAKISPDTISYIEAHGTGTALGDPIEIKAITEAFKGYTSKKQFCGIGSVKTNIGHAVGVSGLASLIKVILSLREKALPPTINFKVPSSFIDFCDGPVYVQDQLTHWYSNGSPRRAGISSFSYSGTNAHLVLEEPPLDERKPETEQEHLFILSGRTVDLLRESISQYVHYLHRHRELRLGDICFTAATGRNHYPYRLAVISRNVKELACILEMILNRADEIFDKDDESYSRIEGNTVVKYGTAIKSEPAGEYEKKLADQLIAALKSNTSQPEERKLYIQLSDLYIKGVMVDFPFLFQTMDVKRCSLPPQPMKKKQFWVYDKSGSEKKQAPEIRTRKDAKLSSITFDEFIDNDRQEETSDHSKENVMAIVQKVWCEVLGYPAIDPENNFFDLGGDSLNGYKIINSINEELHLDLSISVLLLSENYKDFSEEVQRIVGGEEEVLSADDLSDEQIVSCQNLKLPTAAPQRGLYYTYLKNTASLAYNVTHIFKLYDNNTFREVQGILDKLILRHESFRTSFVMENSQVLQITDQIVRVELHHREVQPEPGMLIDDLLQKEAESLRRPFELDKAPLVRGVYLTIKDHSPYLILDMHHIIFDGASAMILINDLYKLCKGETLPPLSSSYGSAVKAVIDSENGVDAQKQKAWWLDQYSGTIPVLELPADFSRSMGTDYQGARIESVISLDLYQKLDCLAKKINVSMFMVLIGAYHTLLSKMTQNREIVIGTAVSGHNCREVEHVIGMFVKTLPLRLKVGEQDSFSSFLKSIKLHFLDACDNMSYPYEDLVNELQIPRNVGRNPLFDVFFALQNRETKVGEVNETYVSEYQGGSKFDLTISATAGAEGLKLDWEYNAGLFREETINRLAHQYEVILNKVIEAPGLELSKLDLLSEADRDLLLNHWNHIETPPLEHRSITDIFEAWVEIQGDHTALIMDDARMSYDELNKRSNKIARQLLALKVRKGSAIAIMFDRGFDMIVSIIAVLKSGCYYLPLDIDLPSERILDMIADAKAELLLTDKAVRADIEGIQTIYKEDIDETLSEENLGLMLDSSHPAYVMYTSGSQGKPKGTLICQKNVIRVVKENGYLEINPSDVLLQLSNYSFDGSVFDIFGALLNGASLVLIQKRHITDLHILGNIIQSQRITVFFMTTLLFNELIDAALECLRDVRVILFGGEAASAAHVNKAVEYLGPGRLCNVYGPTETTVFATCYPVDCIITTSSVPIGKAIGNTSLYVFDEEQKLVPVGAEGELYIGGAGVASKYLNQPELTRERFISNPYRKNEVLYRTGDMVVWNADGNLRFAGRRDNQIKLRGFRIELNEIENKANTYPLIRASHAGIYTNKNGGKGLCIWIVLRNQEADFHINEFKEYLSHSLPYYMIPAYIVIMTELPMNKNGKVDVSKLLGPDIMSTGNQTKPVNKKQQLLYDIWKDVLGISGLGIDDNFFSVGGDSVKLIQVISRIRAAGYKIEMNKLYHNQTISTLARHLVVEQEINNEQGEVSGNCDPSPIQKSFLGSVNAVKRVHHAMRIEVGLIYDNTVLVKVLDRLVFHHDMLRLVVKENGTLVIREDGKGQMYIMKELAAGLTDCLLRQELVSLQQKISLESGPVLAVAVLDHKETFEMFVMIHHMVIDVISWNILIEDIASLLAEPEAQLPSKTCSFPIWTSMLDKWINEEGGAQEELPYWRELAYAAKDYRQIGAAVRRPLSQTKVWKFTMDCIPEEGLTRLNKSYQTQTVQLVIAVITRSLSKWLGTSWILMNLEGHGRIDFGRELDISRTLGWFTSVYPVLLKGIGEIDKVITEIREGLDSVPGNGSGFGALKYLCHNLDEKDSALLGSLEAPISFNYLGLQNNESDGLIKKVGLMDSEISYSEDYVGDHIIDIVGYQTKDRIYIEIRCPETFQDEYNFHALDQYLQASTAEVVEQCENILAQKESSRSLAKQEIDDVFMDLGI